MNDDEQRRLREYRRIGNDEERLKRKARAALQPRIP
jgi:hypothetical protein